MSSQHEDSTLSLYGKTIKPFTDFLCKESLGIHYEVLIFFSIALQVNTNILCHLISDELLYVKTMLEPTYLNQ